MLYVYGATPPLPVAVMVPVALLQEADVLVAVTDGPAICPTVTTTELVHAFTSRTDTVYVPAASPVKLPVACNGPAFKLYCKVATPPLPVAVMVPELLAQPDKVEVAVTVSPAEFGTITGEKLLLQPLASRMFSV